MPKRDFAREAAALEKTMADNRSDAVARLRGVNEAWARSLLGIEDSAALVAAVRAVVERGVDSAQASAALEKLAAAEGHQWEIGTWSTGSGEGLSSMFEVRSLQIARAWLCHAVGASEEADQLARAARDDPNRIAAQHTKHIEALLKRLESLEPDH